MNDRPRMMVRGLPTFYGVYQTYKLEVMTYGGRGWNSETTSQYDGYVLKHIVPQLKEHDNKHVGMFTRQDYDAVMDILLKQGKNRSGEPFEPWDIDGVPEKVNYLIRAIVHTASEHMLCEDVLGDKNVSRKGSTSERNGRYRVRLMKSLTIRQELEVHKYLIKWLFQENSIAGLLLMYALGLRNNEACGVNFGYIREFEEYPGHYYLIVPQSTNLGANTLKILGKTENSGRKVPLPETIVNLLFSLYSVRVQQAFKQGYNGEVLDLPIACKKNKPWERCSADDLSRSAKEMFLRIGMRHEDIVALNQELLEDAQAARDEMEEDEFREIESDPTAYLLRRNFATHIAVLGLRDVEIWYVIGHKIEDEYVTRKAFGDEKLLFAIKRKMDERPILNPIKVEQCLRLRPDESLTLQLAKKLILDIPIDQMKKISINATAIEPGDEITLRVVTKLENGEVSAEYYTHSVEQFSCANRTINGIRVYHDRFSEMCTDGTVME